MARTLQKLINYHTGNAASMPQTTDVSFGEIVVRHNAGNPQLLIKVASGETEYFVPFIASAQISTAIETRVTEVAGTIQSDIADLSGSVQTLSASVVNNYWTSAETKTHLDAAVTSAATYADAQDEALSASVVNYIIENITSTLSGDTESLAADVAALKVFSGVVESNYATKAYADAESAAAVTTVVGASTDDKDADTVWGAKAYADDKVAELSGNVVSHVASEIATVNQNTAATQTGLEQLSGRVQTLSGDLKTYIDTELATVYTYKSSVADMEALQAIENKEVGDVYNVVAAVGEPGDANYTPAGTNYAWNGTEWDALGGVVDLSNYATTASVASAFTEIDTINSKITGATGDVAELSGVVETFSAYVETHYATSADTEAAIEAAKIEAEIASSAYTDSQIQMLSALTSAYVATELTTVKSDISDLKRDSATHDEVATQSAATFESAYTNAVASAMSHSDATTSSAITALKGTASESGDTLGELEAAINTLAGKVGTDTTSLDERLTTVEGKLNNSADTWNNAIQGAEFGAVESEDAHRSGGSGAGATVDSNAELKYTEGGKIVLDLSGLIIDCGEFE